MPSAARAGEQGAPFIDEYPEWQRCMQTQWALLTF